MHSTCQWKSNKMDRWPIYTCKQYSHQYVELDFWVKALRHTHKHTSADNSGKFQQNDDIYCNFIPDERLFCRKYIK